MMVLWIFLDCWSCRERSDPIRWRLTDDLSNDGISRGEEEEEGTKTNAGFFWRDILQLYFLPLFIYTENCVWEAGGGLRFWMSFISPRSFFFQIYQLQSAFCWRNLCRVGFCHKTKWRVQTEGAACAINGHTLHCTLCSDGLNILSFYLLTFLQSFLSLHLPVTEELQLESKLSLLQWVNKYKVMFLMFYTLGISCTVSHHYLSTHSSAAHHWAADRVSCMGEGEDIFFQSFSSFLSAASCDQRLAENILCSVN